MTIVSEAISCLRAIQQKNKFLNAFVQVSSENEITGKALAASQRQELGGSLSHIDGKTFAVKNNFCTKDSITSCASKILADFKPEYNATVVSRLVSLGAIVVGRTNMDEFGMGSHSISGYFGPVQNPHSSHISAHSAGGSSGGSAAAVASSMCFGAIGSDTGGSVRLPASYCGIVGFKPSYGLLSRRGLVPYANSLDTVGIFTRDVQSARLVFECLNIHDTNDPSSLNDESRGKIKKATFEVPRKQHWTIGIPMDYNVSEISHRLKEAWVSAIAMLQDLGHEIVPIALPLTRLAVNSYYIIALAEASSNLAKYDGAQFGPGMKSSPTTHNEPLPNPLDRTATARGKGFGNEVRRRILLGNYSLTSEAMVNYFIKAQRIRRLIKQDFDKIFRVLDPLRPQAKTRHSTKNGVDFLLSPVSISSAPSLQDIMAMGRSGLDGYINDIFTVPASMAGLPAISVPVDTYGGLPCGLQVTAQYGDEGRLFEIATLLENLSDVNE